MAILTAQPQFLAVTRALPPQQGVQRAETVVQVILRLAGRAQRQAAFGQAHCRRKRPCAAALHHRPAAYRRQPQQQGAGIAGQGGAPPAFYHQHRRAGGGVYLHNGSPLRLQDPLHKAKQAALQQKARHGHRQRRVRRGKIQPAAPAHGLLQGGAQGFDFGGQIQSAGRGRGGSGFCQKAGGKPCTRAHGAAAQAAKGGILRKGSAGRVIGKHSGTPPFGQWFWG